MWIALLVLPLVPTIAVSDRGGGWSRMLIFPGRRAEHRLDGLMFQGAPFMIGAYVVASS
jgi:hypothetical protein